MKNNSKKTGGCKAAKPIQAGSSERPALTVWLNKGVTELLKITGQPHQLPPGKVAELILINYVVNHPAYLQRELEVIRRRMVKEVKGWATEIK